MSQQPYDSSMKAILKEDAANILPRLLPGATLIDVLDIEILRSAMRVDRVYRVQYRGRPHIFHLEFQAGSDEEMAYRLLVYHAELLREYRQPIISMIVYLFRTTIVTSPLTETSAEEELLNFHFRVLPLWTLNAHEYVDEHVTSMYTLLPMMGNVDAKILLQAIDEMVEYYRGSEAKLARRLLWLSTFLRRADTVIAPDKRKVEERLTMFDELLEQDEFVQKQRELGRVLGKEEGLAEGEARGEIKASQQILVDLIRLRYPSLTTLAQQKAARTTQVAALQEVLALIFNAPDEATVRFILSSSPAA